MKKAIIKVSYECNNNCLFCHSRENLESGSLNRGEILSKIRRINPYIGMILFSGGEVTIRSDFLDIVKDISNEGLKIGLVTNSRMLSNKKLCSFLYKKGLRYVHTSIHSADKELHNKIARAESFDQTIEGIKNILALKNVELVVNVVINKMNMNHLMNLINLAVKLGIPSLKFSYVFIKGNARHDKSIVPKYSECLDYIKNAVEYGVENGVKVKIDCIPNCVLGDYSVYNDNLRTNRILWMTEVYENDFSSTDYGDRKHYGLCFVCSQKESCAGIYKEYAELYGLSEFKPITIRIPNSFNYFKCRELLQKEVPPIDYQDCRDIYIKNNDKIEMYSTNTHDFDDLAIERIKKIGQVYLNCSSVKSSQNFRADYKKISYDAASGCFNVKKFDIFGKGDEEVKSIISGMKGVVLDIGFGNLFYHETIKNKIEKKEISYIGIDSDIKAVNVANAKMPNADFRCISFEDFTSDIKYDYILLLRSLNHIKNTKNVLSKCCGMLKKTGRIVICDNALFGVLQPSFDCENGDETENRGHYHNFFSDDLVCIAKEFNLIPEFRNDITPNSSNQWVLVLRREDD